MKKLVNVLLCAVFVCFCMAGAGYFAEDSFDKGGSPTVNLADSGPKTLALETNPLTWWLGVGLPVSASYFLEAVSLNLGYQHIGTPMSGLDSVGIEATGHGVLGGFSYYPWHKEEGFESWYGELSYGYATMKAESGETSIEVASHGPTIGWGYRAINGNFTLRVGVYGGYYFARVQDDNYTDADTLTGKATGMTYGLVASVGFIF